MLELVSASTEQAQKPDPLAVKLRVEAELLSNKARDLTASLAGMENMLRWVARYISEVAEGDDLPALERLQHRLMSDAQKQAEEVVRLRGQVGGLLRAVELVEDQA